MAGIKIVLWNPGGIQEGAKRTEAKCDFLESEYKNNDFDILSIQETHHKTEDKLPKYIMNLKKTHKLIDSKASNEDPYAGILMLVSKEWKILERNTLLEGRLIQVKIQKEQEDTIYNILSVYGYPKKAEADNFEKRLDIFQRIENAHEEGMVNMMIGDYNITDSLYDKPINVKLNTNRKLDKEWEEIRSRKKYS